MPYSAELLRHNRLLKEIRDDIGADAFSPSQRILERCK